MAEPQDMILPLLREMRSELRDLRQGNGREFAGVKTRLERIEGRLASMREATNGGSALGRYAAAEVEERLEAIEKRPARLEARP